ARAGRGLASPSAYQVPSRAIRMREWPHRSGFHRSTGGNRRSSISLCSSVRVKPCSSIGGRLSGIAPSLDCFAASLKAGARAMTLERTAIVTGAGKRVGAAIGGALVADGWSVLAHVHHPDDDVPAGAAKVAADLAEPDSADVIFAAANAL